MLTPHSPLSRIFVTAVNEFRRAYSPPCKGGVAAPSTKWSRSEQARTGWSLASAVSECVLKHLRATRLNNCRIRSQVHTPPLQTICWYRFYVTRHKGSDQDPRPQHQ